MVIHPSYYDACDISCDVIYYVIAVRARRMVRIFFLPYLGNRSKSDPCSYELFCLESHIVSFPKVLQLPPESPCILCSITFFLKKNRAVCEIMRKNIVQLDMPQMTIRHMRFACWINKATDTHSEYVILNDFPLQKLMHERISMLLYTYITCLVISYLELFSVLTAVRNIAISINADHFQRF